MRLWVLLVLTVVSVQGFPERRTARSPADQQSKELERRQAEQIQQIQDHKENRVREAHAKCASSIAQKAAAEAKAAQAAQNAAGAQAAHMVKTQLAEKALQAAKAAEAALAGKQAVVEQLQQEVKEAEAVVAENTQAVHQQQGAVGAAINAAQQATALHKLMIQATQISAQLEKSAHCVLEKTKCGLQEKCHNLSEARSRLGHLQHKLQCACAECSATKQAAHCACEAARAACGNARRKKHITKENALARTKEEKHTKR